MIFRNVTRYALHARSMTTYTPRSIKRRGAWCPAIALHKPCSAADTSLRRTPLLRQPALNNARKHSTKEISRNNLRITTNVGERFSLFARNAMSCPNSLKARAIGRRTSDHMPISSMSQRTTSPPCLNGLPRPGGYPGERGPDAVRDEEWCSSPSRVSNRSVIAARCACTLSTARSSNGREVGRCCPPL